FTWVFFLATKDGTLNILKNFIVQIENQMDLSVKVIRCDNGIEFKKVMDEFCTMKGIKREYSVARTPQQNGLLKRRNMTLIEAARIMLARFQVNLQLFGLKHYYLLVYVQNRNNSQDPAGDKENRENHVLMPVLQNFDEPESPHVVDDKQTQKPTNDDKRGGIVDALHEDSRKH
ncbi:putative ribonuclease H-like domain-containing protein, partial [Tanacetum coccineum]